MFTTVLFLLDKYKPIYLSLNIKIVVVIDAASAICNLCEVKLMKIYLPFE